MTTERCDWVVWRRGSGYLCCQNAVASHPGLWKAIRFSLRLWQSKCIDVIRPTSAADLSCGPPPGWARPSAVSGGRSREGRSALSGAAAGRDQAGGSARALGFALRAGWVAKLWGRQSRDLLERGAESSPAGGSLSRVQPVLEIGFAMVRH